MGRLSTSLPVLLLAVSLSASGVRPVAWQDIPAPARDRLAAAGITATSFPSYLERLRRDHARRVREGDLDHLVFYVLQSTHFTRRAPIEPALSAKALVDGLSPGARQQFLDTGEIEDVQVSPPVRSRISDFVRAVDSGDRDPRVGYFRTLLDAAVPARKGREAALAREYLRVMRFVYEKEFVAQRSGRPAEAVEDLYQSRGLSTDTAVEAGYVVYLGLGVAKSLGAARRVRRVLIVGPGLDLAPRTGMIETGPPQSYQPWSVIDALIALGLAEADDLQVIAADINPRVVEHLRRARNDPPLLRFVTGIEEDANVAFTTDYREYFSALGRSVGRIAGGVAGRGRMSKIVAVRPRVARDLDAETLDVVTGRLDTEPFDLAIATNVLPYFDDSELLLAMSNIAAVLAPGGVLLHNETRASLPEIAEAAGFTFLQSRQAIVATVRGAPPLSDTVWVYRRSPAR